MTTPLMRISTLTALLEDIVPSPTPATRSETLAAMLRSECCMARMTSYRLRVDQLVRRMSESTEMMSARDQGSAIYALLLTAVTEMAAHFCEAGKRAGQTEWLDELCEMGDE